MGYQNAMLPARKIDSAGDRFTHQASRSTFSFPFVPSVALMVVPFDYKTPCHAELYQDVGTSPERRSIRRSAWSTEMERLDSVKSED